MSIGKFKDLEKCPQCKELLVHPRNEEPYCEECGWPDENYDKDYNDIPQDLEDHFSKF